MSITDRQKNIVNPYAESLNTEFRSGAGYDYNNRRNKFVLDAIHERYLYFFQFPEVNETLRVKESDNIENPEVQNQDLMAYFALYPQNGKMINGQATNISNQESLTELATLVRNLENNQSLNKYVSKTTELSYQEDFQNNQNVANLIAIPPAHSNSYRNKLRRAFDLPKYQYSEEVNLSAISLSPRASTYVLTDTNVDLYDWRQNCLPGDTDKTYYNTVDKKYYFTRRTEIVVGNVVPYSFNSMRQFYNSDDEDSRNSALTAWEETNQEGKDQYEEYVLKGIQEILRAAGKFSQQNVMSLREAYFPPNNFVLYTNHDLRPGSRWTYAVKIEGSDVEKLKAPESLDPSMEETEISTLDKSKRLISDLNNSAHNVTVQVEKLIVYLSFVRNLLREYDKNLVELNLEPQFLDGIDLSREVDRLNSFFSLLELFYNYNKISIQDSDYIEMFFTDKYELNHVVINGSFYYQGTGGRTYLNQQLESVRVINAFSILTPTTFSILKNVYEMYNESKLSSSDNRREVLDFLSEYLYPKIDLEAIAKKQSEISELERKRIARRKRIFETYSRLTRGNPEDFEFLYSNRPLKYSISSTLNNMDCDSGQMAAAKYAMKFWQAATSKTKLQSVIREAIILIRDEVVEDETNKRRITQAAAYAQQPDRVLQDIEREINHRIFCSLDVIGDFIEDQFLDPLGLPPETSRLTRKTIDVLPKIEFKKCSMTSAKARQSVLYQKMLETILLNFIKSIVAGIAKDFIKALLGCGPEDPSSDLSDQFRKSDYGFVNLMELLDGIDIVRMAEIVNLESVTTQEVDGNVVTNRVPATLNQLKALITDISKMCTPVELQQLLNGDGSNDLLEHILETVSGTLDIQRFEIDVDIYNTLNFTTDRIRNFFMVIGNALDGTLDNLGEMGFTSPLEAYCSKKDGFINPLSLEFSMEDLEAQYNDIINSKIDKINGLCSFLRGLFNIELEIQRLLESLPVLDWYNDLLQDIADISNQFWEYLSELLAKLFGQEQVTRQQVTYNLYNSAMGTQLFYEIFFSLREPLMNQIYIEQDAGRNVHFQTPAGATSALVGFQAAVHEDFWGEDSVIMRGNFGARRNDQTNSNVYTYIWSDPRISAKAGPARINLPQYRDPPQPPSDYLDSGYYSVRNSPPELVRRLGPLLSQANLAKINYGGPRVYEGWNINTLLQGLWNLGDDNSEMHLLIQMSDRIYNYLADVRTNFPSKGWTGETRLHCGNSENPNTIVKYLYRNGFENVCDHNMGQSFNEYGAGSRNLFAEKNYPLIDYRIFTGGTEVSGSSIAVNGQDELVIDGVRMPTYKTDSLSNFYGNLSIGTFSTEVNPTNNESPWGRDRDPTIINAYTTRIDQLIDISVINERGKRIMPKYMAALNRTSLQKTDDICVTAEDVLKAEALVKKIQANMYSFFVNIMPMASPFPNWKSNGTVELISNYLSTKLIDDLKEKQILGPFYQLIPFVKLVYPYIEDDEEFIKNPIILDELSPLENTKNIVKAVYVGILDNISKTSEYTNINKSTFDPGDLQVRYRKLVWRFYHKLASMPIDSLIPYLPEGQDATAASEKIQSFLGQGTGNVTPQGMVASTYYFPVAFQIASYMIYLDQGIRYSNRYPNTHYRMLVEEAGTDDAVLTAVKGQLVERFSRSHRGYPTPVESWDGMSELYYNSAQARRRIEELDRVLESFNTGEGFEEIGFISLERLFSVQDQSILFPDYFQPLRLVEAPAYGKGVPQNLAQNISNRVIQKVGYAMEYLDYLFKNFDTNMLGNPPNARIVTRSQYANLNFGGGIDNPRQGNLMPENRPPFNHNFFSTISDAHIDTARAIMNAMFAHRRENVLGLRFTGGVDQPELRERGILPFLDSTIDGHTTWYGGNIQQDDGQWVDMPGLRSLVPTIRTDAEYFNELAYIFRVFGVSMDYNRYVTLKGGGNGREIREGGAYADAMFYPYFLPEPEEGLFEDDNQFIKNQVNYHTQRFFYEYLYNKYSNYRADQASVLREKNLLQQLINRNE